jgi:hypothetical protein
MGDGEDAVALEWHAGINQIAVGLSSGRVAVLWRPGASTRGAALGEADGAAATRARARARRPGVYTAAPGAAEAYGGSGGPRHEAGKRRRLGPAAERRDELSFVSRPSGGVQGANAAARLQSRERRRAAGLTVEQDPREALLRYATEAEAAEAAQVRGRSLRGDPAAEGATAAEEGAAEAPKSRG